VHVNCFAASEQSPGRVCPTSLVRCTSSRSGPKKVLDHCPRIKGGQGLDPSISLSLEGRRGRRRYPTFADKAETAVDALSLTLRIDCRLRIMNSVRPSLRLRRVCRISALNIWAGSNGGHPPFTPSPYQSPSPPETLGLNRRTQGKSSNLYSIIAEGKLVYIAVQTSGAYIVIDAGRIAHQWRAESLFNAVGVGHVADVFAN